MVAQCMVAVLIMGSILEMKATLHICWSVASSGPYDCQ